MLSSKIEKIAYSSMFIALAYVLPFATGQIPKIGAMLCPMHLPVLLCGFICGWPWGLAVGAISPLLRSFTLGMPPLFPTAVCMTFELAAYGAFTGLFYKLLPKKPYNAYVSTLGAMIIGRVVWGISRLVCSGIDSSSFNLKMFISGAVTGSIPGIILQILFIPAVVVLLQKLKEKNK